MGYALCLMAGLLALLRVVVRLDALPDNNDPFGWTDSLGMSKISPPYNLPKVCFFPLGTAYDLLLVLALVLALGVAAAAFVVALVRRSAPFKRAYRIPHANALGAILLAAALLAMVLLHFHPDMLPDRDTIGLDAMALAVVACLTLAMWSRAREDAPAVGAQQEQAPAGPGQGPGDAAMIWNSMGAIEAKLFRIPSLEAQPVAGVAAAVWAHSGGLGAPPEALDVLVDGVMTRHETLLVGDLPDPTDRLLLVALLFRAMQVDGVPCLVVTEDRELPKRIQAALSHSRAWRCGPMVVGIDEFRHRLEGHQGPAAVFLTMEELSSTGIRALAPGQPGASWARTLGLVCVPQVDRGGPVQATHRLFVLQRLALALHVVGARWTVVATGLEGPGTRAMLERAFPGFPVRLVPLRARCRPEVRVFLAKSEFRNATGHVPWLARAVQPLRSAGLTASIGDPLGTFDAASWNLDPLWTQVQRDVTLGGHASVSNLDGAWFLTSYRALRNLPSTGKPHDALWGFDVFPLVQFLCRPEVLPSLEERSKVPAPRPLLGASNGPLLRAHIAAAWRDGPRDIDSLCGYFDRAQVEAIIDAPSPRYALRYSVTKARLERVRLAPEAKLDTANPLRDTVTEHVASIILDPGGQELGHVDMVLAATRYYPGRIFARGPDRFQVPLQAVDAKRKLVRVVRVQASERVNEPLLHIAFSSPSLIEDFRTVQTGRRKVALAAFQGVVTETVHGWREVGPGGRVLTFDHGPVVTQFPSRARVIVFPQEVSPRTLLHLARSLMSVFGAHIFAAQDACEVIVTVPGDAFNLTMPGVAAIDRNVGGMGLCEALDPNLIDEALRWTWAVLNACSCVDGCPHCTESEVLAAGADKAGVMRLLGE
jgi:hypothetical protein